MPNSLQRLPEPTIGLFGYRHPWTMVRAKEVAQALRVDPATFNTWVYRGVGPPPLRRIGKRPNHRISRVLRWLAARSGNAIGETDVWREYLENAGVGALTAEMDDAQLISFIRVIDPAARLEDPLPAQLIQHTDLTEGDDPKRLSQALQAPGY